MLNNIVVVAIYAPFAVTSVVVLLLELFRRFKRKEDYFFALLCVCSVCWYVSNIWCLLTSSVELVTFFTNFGFIFIGFIPPLLLLFVLYFYRTAYKPSKKATALLLAVPTVTSVMALTAQNHLLLVKQIEIISLSPLREFHLDFGPWFWVHASYSYVVSMILIGIILYQHFRLPRFYRFPSTMMITGVSITLLGNVLYLMRLFPEALDITIVTMSLSLVMFNLGIINNNRSRFVHFSRAQIYHYLDLFIFVLDDKQQIVDINRPAINWFASNGITLSESNSTKLQSVIEALLRKGGYFISGAIGKGEAIIHFSNGEYPMVFRLNQQAIVDARGETLGSIAVLTDVTQNWMLLEKLEEKAGMDCLTGLANRHSYEGAKERLDAPNYLPLSVVMCDVNGLKQVNDTLGHDCGDAMIRAVAKVLERECPPGKFLARFGGDEFIYLLPNTKPEEADMMIERICAAFARCDGNPFNMSVAIGTATKFTKSGKIDDIIALADSRMYENKVANKQAAFTISTGKGKRDKPTPIPGLARGMILKAEATE